MSNGTAGAAPKKKLPIWAWIGIGCGCLVLLVVVVVAVGGYVGCRQLKKYTSGFEKNPALAASRLIVGADPDLEEVSVDEQAGTITVRRKSTGEEMTLNFDEVQKGRIGLSTDKGEVTLETDSSGGGLQITGSDQEGKGFKLQAGGADSTPLPDWVPRYPGATASGTYHMEQEGGAASGGYQVTTSDPVDVVLEQYRQDLKKAGFQVTINTFAGDGGSQAGTLVAADEASKRTVQVMVAKEGEGTSAVVTFASGQ
jgi:hypothetical protein